MVNVRSSATSSAPSRQRCNIHCQRDALLERIEVDNQPHDVYSAPSDARRRSPGRRPASLGQRTSGLRSSSTAIALAVGVGRLDIKEQGPAGLAGSSCRRAQRLDVLRAGAAEARTPRRRRSSGTGAAGRQLVYAPAANRCRREALRATSLHPAALRSCPPRRRTRRRRARRADTGSSRRPVPQRDIERGLTVALDEALGSTATSVRAEVVVELRPPCRDEPVVPGFRIALLCRLGVHQRSGYACHAEVDRCSGRSPAPVG